MDHQQWLIALDMLPISEVMFAQKSSSTNSESGIDWILYDVYKIASDFPLEISIYGLIFSKNTTIESNEAFEFPEQRLEIDAKFLSKSTRDDLKGVQLKCGFVVCIAIALFIINLHMLFINVKMCFGH